MESERKFSLHALPDGRRALRIARTWYLSEASPDIGPVPLDGDPRPIAERIDERLAKSVGKMNADGDVWNGERYVPHEEFRL